MVVDARNVGGPLQPLVIHLAVIHGNVTLNGLREYYTVLHNNTALAAPPLQVVFAQVAARQDDGSAFNGIIAQQ